MDGSNNRNSSYWIDELAKLANGTESVGKNSGQAKPTDPNVNKNNGVFEEVKMNLGDLVDVSESSEYTAQQDHDINELNDSGRRDSHSRESVTFRTAVMPSQSREESRSPAGDHQKMCTEESEKLFVSIKKRNYNTEQVSCTLHDLILGTNSTTIKSAISKMEEEGKQYHNKNIKSPTSSSSIVSFESIVEEQKNRVKSYNTNAKEFVPSFAK